jgi:phosphoribosylglycinamide formyltransferase-1
MLSGRGSNFRALFDSLNESRSKAEISVVLTDKPQAPGALFAAEAGIPVKIVERRAKERSVAEFNAELARTLLPFEPDLIVLAGFMRVLTADFIGRFRGKIINIHPSLLPAFKGLHAQRQALEAGVLFAGCSVHVVTEELDSGPILAQAVVPVLPQDDEESLAARILTQEHRILPAVVSACATGNIQCTVTPAGAVEVQRRPPPAAAADAAIRSI